jgi:hypothetical protein
VDPLKTLFCNALQGNQGEFGVIVTRFWIAQFERLDQIVGQKMADGPGMR